MAILNHGSTLRTADGGQTTTTIVTAANIGTYGVATNATYYVGTTQNIFNRASGAQTLTGISIDGNAATVSYPFNNNNALDLNSTGTTNQFSAFNVYYPSGGSYNQPLAGSQHFKILQFGRYNADDVNYWRGQMAMSFYTDRMFFRKEYTSTWGSWMEFLHTGNYAGYSAFTTSLTSTVDARAPIFYDSNDTAYYIDPASNSRLLNLGLGNVTPDLRLSVSGDAQLSGILYLGGTAGSYNSWGSRTYTTSGVLYNNSSSVEFNNYGYGSTWTFTLGGGNATSSGAFRAPVFYDSDNTAYYLDAANSTTSLLVAGKVGIGTTSPGAPLEVSGASGDGVPAFKITSTSAPASFNYAGTMFNSSLGASKSYSLMIGKSAASKNSGYIGYNHSGTDGSNTNFLTFGHFQSDYLLNILGNGNVGIGTTSPANKLHVVGSAYSDTDFRAPIFYDSNDTGYFLNPNSTSNLNNLRAATISAANHGLTCVYYGGGATPTNGYLITTNIDYSTFNMPTVIIEGYAYGNGVPIHLEIVWYAYLNSWTNLAYTNLGNWNPGTVSIGTNASGKVCLHLSNLIYYGRFNVRCIYDQGNAPLEGWTVTDATTSALTRVTTISKVELATSITGNAATVTNGLTTGNYNSYALPLTGGTVSGLVRINNQLQVGQNTNGTAYIDAYGGYAWFGRDSNTTGIRIDGSANVHMTNALNVVNAITQNGNQVLNASNYVGYSAFTGSVSSGGNITATSYIYTSTYLQTGGNLIYPSGYGSTQRLEVGNSANNNWIDGLTIAPGGTVTAPDNMRSPIFYDSNDTTYYTDPAGLTRFNALNIGNQGALTGNTTYALGAYHNARYMVGLRYSSGGAAYPWLVHDSWNGSAFIIHFNGVGDKFNFSESGIAYAAGDFRAPIFYDSNNTAYYLDPASTSNLNIVTVNDVLTYGVIAAKSFSVSVNTSTYWTIVRPNGSSIATGYVYRITLCTTGTGTDTGEQYLLANVDSAGWVIKTVTKTGSGSNWPYVFLDSGVPKVKTDHASLYTVTVLIEELNSGNTGGLPSVFGLAGLFTSDNGTPKYRAGLFSSDNTLLHSGNYSGYSAFTSSLTSTVDARAPIFYDSNDTAYYVDPASTSILNGTRHNTVVAGSTSAMTSAGQLAIYSSANPYISFHDGGVGRTAYMQETGGRFYFGEVTYTESEGSFRAPLFYDSNNTAYYLDPASTSNLNNITAAGTLTVTNIAKNSTSPIVINSGLSASLGLRVYYDMNLYNTLTFTDSAWNSQGAISGSSGVLNISAANATSNFTKQAGYSEEGGSFRAPIFYDSNDTAYYVNPNSTSNLYDLTVANNLTVNGNTYLGNAGGDTVFVNDIIRIGATDSGDASLFFGEGSVAGSDYGARWYWDSGYTFTWYTRNAGTDTSLFDYVTNDTTYLNWRRHFHMQNKEINYNAQIHFNAGTRFVGQDTNYLVFRSDSTSVGGIRVQDGGIATKGYIGYWDSSGGGILNNTGNWALRYNFGSSSSGGTLYGSWISDTDFRAPIFYDSNNTAYYVDPNSTSNLVGLTVANTITGNINGYANYISAQTNPIGAFNVGLTRPKGASYTTTASSVTGAIKIKMPPGIPVHGMWKMTIKVYEYGSRGNGYTIECGCHLYPSTAYNRYQYAIGVDANIALTIRYGTDGTSGCIWIGENATTWSYPQIHVTEFSNGFNNPGNPDWNAGTWGVTIGTIDNSVAVDGPYTISLPLASSATTAGSISGYNNPTTAATANTIVYRDSGGDISTRYFLGSYQNSSDDISTGTITYIMAKFGDNYHRSATAAKVATFISGQTMNIAGSSTSCTGNAATVTNGMYLSGDQFISGAKYFTSNKGAASTVGANATYSLEAYSSDAGAAGMSFHRGGYYAVNMGLDPDNVLRIGGWSASANRLQLDMSGNLTLAGVVDATQFRDSANTAYYVDPASTSNLNAITAAGNITAAQYYTGGWFRNNSSGNGLYNEATGEHFYSDAADMWNVASANGTQGIRLRTGGHNGTIRGYFYGNDSNDVGFLNNAGSWRVRVVGGDYVLFDGSSVRAQIFYDSNDTGYYTDPAGTSILNVVRANSYVQKSASQSLSGTVGCTIDVAAAGIHVLTLAASTTISSFTYNYRAPNPSVNTIMLVIKYGGTASITWTNVLWANGVTPTITGVSGYADVYMLTSYQGTTGVWIGTVVSQGVVSTSL